MSEKEKRNKEERKKGKKKEIKSHFQLNLMICLDKMAGKSMIYVSSLFPKNKIC